MFKDYEKLEHLYPAEHLLYREIGASPYKIDDVDEQNFYRKRIDKLTALCRALAAKNEVQLAELQNRLVTEKNVELDDIYQSGMWVAKVLATVEFPPTVGNLDDFLKELIAPIVDAIGMEATEAIVFANKEEEH
jgi:hypothetical protein